MPMTPGQAGQLQELDLRPTRPTSLRIYNFLQPARDWSVITTTEVIQSIYPSRTPDNLVE